MAATATVRQRLARDLRNRAKVYLLALQSGATLRTSSLARQIAGDIKARARRSMSEMVDDVDAARMRDLPCWRCQNERARDVRAWLSQSDRLDIAQCSPVSGLPLSCCRIASMAIR
jgi:hypothetical protein